ncbi:MAG TPA: sugar transferase [Acidobacteriota bacterium]|nr:sugar transferase [Acidobacteriota bacterium]
MRNSETIPAEGVPVARRGVARILLSHWLVIVVADYAVGLASYLLAWWLSLNLSIPLTRDIIPETQFDVVRHPWIVLLLSQVFLLYIFGLYDEMRRTRFREIVAYVAAACLLQFAAVTSVIFLTNSPFPRKVLVLFAFFNFLFLALWRMYVKVQVKRHVVRVLVVAEQPASADEIIGEIERNPWMGMKVAGVVFSRPPAGPSHEGEDPPPEAGGSGRYPVLGNLADLDTVIPRYGVEEIIMASEPTWKDRVMNSVSRLQVETDVRIAILPSVYEMVIGKMRHVNIHDTPLIDVRRNPNEPFQRFLKRTFDIVVSAALLLAASPLMLLTALVVKLSSAGSVFYSQKRVGRGGHVFRLIKFRTMVADAEEPGREVLAKADDPRATAAGRWLRRFRLDELPQFFNVLRGDMSLVGPRPERPGFVSRFEEQVPGYAERHKIKPGITGLAQVRGYYHTSAESKLKYDLAYIYNYSFSLDILIVLETVKVVLTRPGS